MKLLARQLCKFALQLKMKPPASPEFWAICPVDIHGLIVVEWSHLMSFYQNFLKSGILRSPPLLIDIEKCENRAILGFPDTTLWIFRKVLEKF